MRSGRTAFRPGAAAPLPPRPAEGAGLEGATLFLLFGARLTAAGARARETGARGGGGSQTS